MTDQDLFYLLAYAWKVLVILWPKLLTLRVCRVCLKLNQQLAAIDGVELIYLKCKGSVGFEKK
jgi:hypothetical protein